MITTTATNTWMNILNLGICSLIPGNTVRVLEWLSQFFIGEVKLRICDNCLFERNFWSKHKHQKVLLMALVVAITTFYK